MARRAKRSSTSGSRAHGTGRASYWRALIEKQKRSGLSIRAFCRGQSVSEASFYSWRRKLAKRSVPIALSGSFAEVVLTGREVSSQVEVRRGEITIRIQGGCDASLLRDAVSALRDEPC